MVPYSDDELKVIGEHINTTSFGGKFTFKTPKYNTPITPRENVALCVKREKPYWFPSSADFLKKRDLQFSFFLQELLFCPHYVQYKHRNGIP